MCIAVPMKIVDMNRGKNTARASLGGNTVNINIRLVSPKPGDYVLVHAGCAIEIIQKETADELAELVATLEELARDED